jgi:TDG/mug DNA glycosylase family protein
MPGKASLRAGQYYAHPRNLFWKIIGGLLGLDSDIDDSTIVPNDFKAFLKGHPAIGSICFNGAKAESSYRKHVLPGLPATLDITYHALPSTSPANAAIPYLKKLERWQIVKPAA